MRHLEERSTLQPYRKRGRYSERQEYEHIVAAELALGHALQPGVQVHHVDGNGLNNAPSNLVICQNQAYHSLLHARTMVVKAGGDPNTQRVCGYCRQVKALAGFGKNSENATTGRMALCKSCKNAQVRRSKNAWRARKRALGLSLRGSHEECRWERDPPGRE